MSSEKLCTYCKFHPSSKITAARSAVFLIVVASATGCAGRIDETRYTTGFRMLPITHLPALSFADISAVSSTNTLDMKVADNAHPWTLHQVRRLESNESELGIDFVTTGDDPQFATEIDVLAREVHAITIEGRRFGPTPQVFWAGPGESFDGRRVHTVQCRPGDRRVTFNLAGHPLWEGRIARLRIDPASSQGHQFRMSGVALERSVVDPERLQDAAEGAFRVTLGTESRPAFVGCSAVPRRWEFDAVPGDRLDVSLGFLNEVDEPGAFSVTVERGGHQAFVAFDESMSPSASGLKWHPRTIPLLIDAPGRTTVEFRTDCDPDTVAAGAIPVWGSPRIVRSTRTAQPPSILLVSLDTLRPDHLSAYGYERPTSPTIDRLAAQGATVFETVVASAPWTLPSHMSMLTGLGSVNHGINHETPNLRHPLITQHLAAAGYQTIAITAGGYLHPDYGMSAGFDSYRAWRGSTGSEGELASNTSTFIEWLERGPDQPFFAFFHSYEIHSPYRPRAPFFAELCQPRFRDFDGVVETRVAGYDHASGYLALNAVLVNEPGHGSRPLNDDELDLVIDCYNAGIAFADHHLGRILATLDSTGLRDNTVVIVTSDHGEALGEHGYFGHGRLFDPEILVPLIIAPPGASGAISRVEQQVRLQDLAPTILEIAGIEPPEDLDGVSLLGFVESGHADVPDEAWTYTPKTNHGISLRVDNRTKYTFNNTGWSPAHGNEQVFDLDSDPGELRNLAKETGATGEHRRKVWRTLRRDQNGLVLRIRNDGPQTLSGEFHFDTHQDLIITKVKGLNLPTNALSVLSATSIGFAAESGQAYTVILEDLKASTLRIVAYESPKRDALLDITLDISDPTRRHLVHRTRDGWAAAQGPNSEFSTVLDIAWQHTTAAESASRTAIDPALVEQLRALGYTE